MDDESGFLNAIAAAPADDTARLVYADWLDERGTEEAARKAEFLRTQHAMTLPPRRRPHLTDLRERVAWLARTLPPEWLAVVSRLCIDNCGAAGNRVLSRVPLTFAYECPKQWADLRPTGDPTVRFCTACEQNVYYCDSIQQARRRVIEGRCIAVDVAIPRKPNDIRPRSLRMGRVFPTSVRYQRERERLQPDEVSQERERRRANRRPEDDSQPG